MPPSSSFTSILALLLLFITAASRAFSPLPPSSCRRHRNSASVASPLPWSPALGSSLDDQDIAQRAKEIEIEPKRNPDRPELPELKNDFDWDAKFGSDEDWITSNVPGKMVLNEIDLARQVTALDKLEEQWRQRRLETEYEESKKVGFVAEAELANGRTAMFFLVTGLLTEYWTGVDLPGQVEEMLRIGGFIGLE